MVIDSTRAYAISIEHSPFRVLRPHSALIMLSSTNSYYDLFRLSHTLSLLPFPLLPVL